jgi:two-component system, OmpR family, phosphate regulon sensor histidine kinase PhoR
VEIRICLEAPMNSPAPDLSLYRFLEGDDERSPITVTSPTLKGVVRSLFDLLSERQVKAIVWVKLPNSPSWQGEIDRFAQQGSAEKVYHCTIRDDRTPAKEMVSPLLVPVALEASAHLKRECFVLVLSEGFSALLLARLVAGASLKEARWHLLYQFERERVEQLLEQIQQSIAITDRTPEEVLNFTCPIFAESAPPTTDSLQQLLLQQIRQTERVQERVKTEEQTGESIASLTESLHHSHEVLHNLGQELKLPLTNMKTALRLLDSLQSKREQRQRYLDLLQRECDRQSLLLTGLQEFIQFTQTAPPPFAHPFKLEDLVPGIVSTYQPLAEERGIVLGYTIPAGFPAIACPEPWLRQILLNLLNNSLKFTPNNGRVQVQATLGTETVELTVSDTGTGIEPEELPRIFQSFYKGRSATPHAVNSAGLGLTIVQYLVTRCGGSIEVTSKPGRGTTFKIAFPLLVTE